MIGIRKLKEDPEQIQALREMLWPDTGGSHL
jgi:hypothetical protein